MANHCIAFLQQKPCMAIHSLPLADNPAEFKLFREQLVCLGRGPESFIAKQAAFAMRRMRDTRDRSEFDRAEQTRMVHRDLMRRLGECLKPEGFAEQYLWMLKEGGIIENTYVRRAVDAENARVEENSGVQEDREGKENAEQYNGSLSECSDPDGWILQKCRWLCGVSVLLWVCLRRLSLQAMLGYGHFVCLWPPGLACRRTRQRNDPTRSKTGDAGISHCCCVHEWQKIQTTSYVWEVKKTVDCCLCSKQGCRVCTVYL